MLRHWSQFVPNMSTDIRGHEALHHRHHYHQLCSPVCMNMRRSSTFTPRNVNPFIPTVPYSGRVTTWFWSGILASCRHGPLKRGFLYSKKRWLSICHCFFFFFFFRPPFARNGRLFASGYSVLKYLWVYMG